MVELQIPVACRECPVGKAALEEWKKQKGIAEKNGDTLTMAWLSCIGTWRDLLLDKKHRDAKVYFDGMRGSRPINTYQPIETSEAVKCANPNGIA